MATPIASARHEHPHPTRPTMDDTLTYYQTMEVAVRELLIEKGIVTADDMRRQVEDMDGRSPGGAAMVAQAWIDPAYKERAARRRQRGGWRQFGLDRGPLQARGRREHAGGAQRDRLHAVLLLSALAARPAAGLVQEPQLSLARGARAARGAARVRAGAARTTSPCACTIPLPTCAISCCRCDPRAPKDGARSGSRRW